MSIFYSTALTLPGSYWLKWNEKKNSNQNQLIHSECICIWMYVCTFSGTRLSFLDRVSHSFHSSSASCLLTYLLATHPYIMMMQTTFISSRCIKCLQIVCWSIRNKYEEKKEGIFFRVRVLPRVFINAFISEFNYS